MVFNDLEQLLRNNRTCRRFMQSQRITPETLSQLVNLARFTASGRNAQPLKYLLIWREDDCARIFPLLAWAGYFKDWPGPVEGERPAAYLVQCLDTRYGKDVLCDDGLQLEAITLGACAKGLRGCIIKSFNAPALTREFNLPEHLLPRYVLALGHPAESIVLEDMDGSSDADFKYYRTSDGVHHVPKRPLDELIISTNDCDSSVIIN